MCLASGTQWFHLTHLGNVFWCESFYNGVLYSLRKKGLSLLRLAKDHKLRLTWFRKLGLVEPPNSDNVRVCVYVVNTSHGWDQEDKKRHYERYCAKPYCLSISKQSQECFPKDEQNVLKRNWLVAYHTDIVLIINVEINLIRPDMNEIYQ